MNEVCATRRWRSAAGGLWGLLGLLAGCADGDHTFVCRGPGCADFQGFAGRNSLTSGLDGLDAGADAGDAGDAGEACEVAFVSPAPADGGAASLGGDADLDDEACGASYVARVVVRSNAALVTLFVNDSRLGERAPSERLAAFDAALGNRGERPNVLRAEALMADGQRCRAELGDVHVDCPGPSCSVERPRPNADGYLGQADDADPEAAGLQTSIEIGTELEHAGQSVRLSIDGDFERSPAATVLEAGGRGAARFEDVTLEPGPRSVQAECRDAFGLRTLSPAVEWDIDLEACVLELASVAAGVDPVTPGDDLDQNASNGLDVLARGSITGERCQSVRVGPCGQDGAELALGGLLGDDGGFILPIKLAAESAALTLCARVMDAAGNASADVEAPVNVRVEPPSVALLSPAALARYNLAGSLGAIADADPGTPASCEIAVSVGCSDVNVDVQLFADGAALATAPCTAQSGAAPFPGLAAFPAVSLPSRNDGAQVALSAEQSVRGLAPGQSPAVLVQPDCAPPSCSFASPAPGTTALGAALDASAEDGYQLDVGVATALDAAGQSVRLTIDGDATGALLAEATPGDAGAVALFAALPLSEAQHDVLAVCADAAGNESAAEATWRVDVTPCSTTLLVAEGHDPVVPSDDLDPESEGLQVSITGQTSGECAAARVGLCDALAGEPSALAPDGSFELSATVPAASGSVELCAEVQDAAGNITTEAVSVGVRVDAPSVAFQAPAAEQQFTASGGCTTSAVISCSDEGAPVELFEDGVSRGTAPCSGGQVSIPLTLQTKNDGAATELGARQVAEGIPSELASVSVRADCEPPQLSISAPACGGQLALAGDDVDRGSPGLQVDVTVANGGEPAVTLTVTRASSVEREATGDATETEFAAVDLGAAGEVTLDACATDAQGNTGCAASCLLTVAAEPSVVLTSPRPPATFTIEDDCDTATPGLSIAVQGTSNAAEGSPVELSVGSGTPQTALLASGAYGACVQAPDGEDQTLSATVTDSATGLSATTRVIVSVNTSPPPAIAAPAFAVTGRRAGTVDLTWQSVLDASGDPLVAYHVRCAPTAIETEAEWSAASAFPVSLTPANAAGFPETYTLTGFHTGLERYCLVRGEDAYGQLGELSGGAPTLAEVQNPFLTLDFSPVLQAGSAARANVAALGDVNGDGANDFAYATPNRGVQVFFGGPALDPAPAVTITAADQSGAFNHELGWSLSGLGDVNGDGRPDFAVGARYMTHPASVDNGGSLFVFFGRDAATPWPAAIEVQPNPGCGADICFHGSERFGYLGSSVTATDFDGAGAADLVIGARNRSVGGTPRVGSVFVLLGGAQLAVPSGTVFELPGASLQGFTIDPPTSGTRAFGFDVAGVGSGSDARGDLVISALGRSQEGINAEVFHVTGRAYAGGGGLVGAAAPPPFAVGSPGTFSTLRPVGDVDGDSVSDVWVATNLAAGGVSPVYLGRSNGFSGVRLFGFTNDVVTDFWGTYVATGSHPELGSFADLDQNGFGEVFVGSLAYDPAGTAQDAPGTAELFYSDGSTEDRTRSGADVHFTAVNGQLTPGFVGDVTGDGFADAILLDSGGTNPSSLTLLY